MALKTTLEDTKDRLDALLTYANEITGADDINIGDAIERLADGYGSGIRYSLDDLVEGSEPSGDIVTNATTIKDYVLQGCSVTSLNAPNCTYLGTANFKSNGSFTSIYAPNCEFIGSECFRDCHAYGADSDFATDFPKVKTLKSGAFRSCAFRKIIIPDTVTTIESSVFASQVGNVLTKVIFRGTPSSIHVIALATNRNLTDVYVP